MSLLYLRTSQAVSLEATPGHRQHITETLSKLVTRMGNVPAVPATF